MINSNLINAKGTPLVLIILDGWGYRKESAHNAIAAANTPTWDWLWQHCPHTLISGSGTDVGLPDGQMGNSEVGHLHIGAGRLAPQDLVRINHAIESKEFFMHAPLTKAVELAAKQDKAVHILGLVSPGGVHSHETHIQAMIELAAERGARKIYLHAILDGRDTPPKSAKQSLANIENQFKALELNEAGIANIIGRYYAMDRDKRWDRTQVAYDMLTAANVDASADFNASSAIEALDLAYQRGETDEFVKPTHILKTPADKPVVVEDGDVVIFMNFRSDRARQLTRAFTDPNFSDFKRQNHPKISEFVTLTEYSPEIAATVAYTPMPFVNTFGDYLAKQGGTQLRIAETEKYAHVTFFFNGGREKIFPGEDRILIPSPKIATYDLQPEMSAVELTDQLVAAIKSKKYTAIICNYANPDMVGHTGNFKAAVKAVETIDQCLKRIVEALKSSGGEALITSDHGNVESMYDEQTGQAHTAHTTALVPLVYYGRPAHFNDNNSGVLFDIAPTMLYLLGLEKPMEMTGKNLLMLAGVP
jgi:2,3-bisphosphoglycerate-independent phosphoglycerate mutase